jgi:DNA polymerase-3 subunit alpha
MDLFGLSGDAQAPSSGGITLPNVQEYPKGELMRMEREVTGLYLSGHPMDEYRSDAKSAGAVDIGDILADFSQEGGNTRFADDQQITVAGVIESFKTKPTRNNSLMAYLALDDGSGSIELLAFQRVIDESGGYMQVNTPVLAFGKLSARDEKDPQVVLDMLRPITDAQSPAYAGRAGAHHAEHDSNVQQAQHHEGKTLYVKLQVEDSPEYERLKLVHMMFPGHERLVIHFVDTKKNVGAKCIIHDAFVNELREMLGGENVVVR